MVSRREHELVDLLAHDMTLQDTHDMLDLALSLINTAAVALHRHEPAEGLAAYAKGTARGAALDAFGGIYEARQICQKMGAESPQERSQREFAATPDSDMPF